MLKRKAQSKQNQVKITFALDGTDPRLPAVLTGDFNSWSLDEHPLKPRSNGTWSTVVSLPKDGRYRFRYRSLDGSWFNDEQADAYEVNEFGTQDGVIVT